MATLETPPEESPDPQSATQQRLHVVTDDARGPAATPQLQNMVVPARRGREKRVMLTNDEEQQIERLVRRFAEQLETPLKLSHLLRATMTLLLHAENELLDASRGETLIRPGNGNAPELADFERRVAQMVATAFREARPFR